MKVVRLPDPEQQLCVNSLPIVLKRQHVYVLEKYQEDGDHHKHHHHHHDDHIDFPRGRRQRAAAPCRGRGPKDMRPDSHEFKVERVELGIEFPQLGQLPKTSQDCNQIHSVCWISPEPMPDLGRYINIQPELGGVTFHLHRRVVIKMNILEHHKQPRRHFPEFLLMPRVCVFVMFAPGGKQLICRG